MTIAKILARFRLVAAADTILQYIPGSLTILSYKGLRIKFEKL